MGQERAQQTSGFCCSFFVSSNSPHIYCTQQSKFVHLVNSVVNNSCSPCLFCVCSLGGLCCLMEDKSSSQVKHPCVMTQNPSSVGGPSSLGCFIKSVNCSNLVGKGSALDEGHESNQNLNIVIKRKIK